MTRPSQLKVSSIFSRRAAGWSRWLILIAGYCTLHGITQAQTTDLDPEKFATVQAAYIYNLSRFVQWPDLPTSSFHICLIGNAQQLLLQQLQQGIKGKTIHTLPVEIALIAPELLHTDPNGQQLQQCQVLYLTQDPEQYGFAALPQLTAQHVLRIGSPDLPRNSYSQVDLVLENNRILLYLNSQSLQQSGLQVNPALLSIARQRSKS